jgi:hypothetical protein
MVINYTWTRPIQFSLPKSISSNFHPNTTLHLLDLQCRHFHAVLNESHGQTLSIRTSYSELPGFKSRPEGFVVFLSPSRKILGQYLDYAMTDPSSIFFNQLLINQLTARWNVILANQSIVRRPRRFKISESLSPKFCFVLTTRQVVCFKGGGGGATSKCLGGKNHEYVKHGDR